ncbi:helix-turn-helix domain-containing protein [Chitinophaga sp. GCM10012297]|uniref:Helix-turn-helix domain-containing protein n=1 Tax=Chitinophaga chungangae TaxID=2821488 RepID=A0ABS3YJD9_9BACT|nr:helix-turn-helix domain-containing protein [Chitinophaga chungangae]MBO9154799.1 helix-turn-helix domain-containing protein [Chitinophaga chungangae]
MNFGQQILFLLGAIGALNGIVLGLYLLLNRKKRTLPLMLLGVLLLALSIRVSKSVFLHFNPALPRVILQLGLTGCFLIGPALYYYTKAVLNKVTKLPIAWKRSWVLLLVPFAISGIIWPYHVYPGIWNHGFVHVIYAVWLGYLIATGIMLWSASSRNRFLNILFAGNLFIFLMYLLSFLQIYCAIYISGPLSFTILLFAGIILTLGSVKFETAAKAEKKKIAENDAKRWLEKLDEALQDKTLYKDPNLKLNDLAQKINISQHQLSQLLNDNLGKSFSTYINEYRINEACKLISSNGALTFEAIGYEVGYNSKSTFYAAFRKIKDTTPALYKETLENQAG